MCARCSTGIAEGVKHAIGGPTVHAQQALVECQARHADRGIAHGGVGAVELNQLVGGGQANEVLGVSMGSHEQAGEEDKRNKPAQQEMRLGHVTHPLHMRLSNALKLGADARQAPVRKALAHPVPQTRKRREDRVR